MALGRDLELRKLLAEASQALARLDSGRLEEIALSCADLFRGVDGKNELPTRDLFEIRRELLIFGRIVEVAKGNLSVLRSLRERETAILDYGPTALRSKGVIAHGDH